MSNTVPWDERDALSWPGQIVLWSLRAALARWPLGATETKVGRLFDQLGAPAAGPALCGYMATLASGRRRGLQVYEPARRQISDDERTLVDVLALQQRRRTIEAAKLLFGMAIRPAALAACCHAGQCAAALDRAGLILPLPGEAGWRYAAPAVSPARALSQAKGLL